MNANRLFSNAQRYEQNGEIDQNVAFRSARAIVLCVQAGDIFYTDNGAAPQDCPLFLIQCGTVFSTKAGFFDARSTSTLTSSATATCSITSASKMITY